MIKPVLVPILSPGLRGFAMVVLTMALGCSNEGVAVVEDDAGGGGLEDLGGSGENDSGPVMETPPCPLSIDVERDLLRARCATSGCHTTLDQAGTLDMQSPGMRERLTGAAAATCSGRRVIVAGRPDQSYLVEKLGERPRCGARMPSNGTPFTADEVACVRRWIADGMAAPTDAGASDVPAEVATPCSQSDMDGDGFGTDPSCAMRDCNDANQSIYPGATEACNGMDDDCNGRVDDGFVTSACGVGACRREAPLCVDGRYQTCTPGMPSAEVCDGIDNDCDGMVDEGVAAMTCGVGRCQRSVTCSGGRFPACTAATPMAETCNGMDDNCDGVVDEGFRSAVDETSYTVLAARHDGCNQSTRMGPPCNAAIHRYCTTRGCATTGYGPVENSGDVSVVACVRGEVESTSYTDLGRAHESCNGSIQRMGPECNAAIHRWCAGRGFVSGFGPLENSGDFAAVACLRAGHATAVQTSYTELGRSHAGCTRNVRWGSDCNAAIHRFCAGRGFASGYGPVENSGDSALVVCVAR